MKLLLSVLCCLAVGAISGCAASSAVSIIGSIATTALEASGLKKPDAPEVPDAMKVPRTVSIKLHASETLNLDASGRPLALVTKVYKLKQSTAFLQAPYDTFLNPQKEKEALGTDLLEVKEVTLVPGQHYEVAEKVSYEAGFIGVVALFRNPAPARWRVAFPAASAEKSGIVVGMHACVMSVGTGTTTSGDPTTANQLLSSVRCP